MKVRDYGVKFVLNCGIWEFDTLIWVGGKVILYDRSYFCNKIKKYALYNKNVKLEKIFQNFYKFWGLEEIILILMVK